MQNLNSNNALASVQGFFNRGWELILLFPQKAQDLRIAYISVIVIACLSWDLGQLASRFSKCFFKDVDPKSTEAAKIRAIGTLAAGVTIASVLQGFYSFAKLPIKGEHFIAISISVLVVRVLIQTYLDRDRVNETQSHR